MPDLSHSYEILNTTVAASSEAMQLGANAITVHATGVTSSGTGSATVIIEVSNDTSYPWLQLSTLTLTLGTTATADGAAFDAGWKFARASVSAISGTGATVRVSMGV